MFKYIYKICFIVTMFHFFKTSKFFMTTLTLKQISRDNKKFIRRSKARNFFLNQFHSTGFKNDFSNVKLFSNQTHIIFKSFGLHVL